jgi:hypothetical protein
LNVFSEEEDPIEIGTSESVSARHMSVDPQIVAMREMYIISIFSSFSAIFSGDA